MPKSSKDLNKKDFLEMMRLMLLARNFDLQLAKLFNRGLVHGMTHYSVGEEASNVGSIYALEKTDYIYSNHRGHAQTISKGIDINKMMAEILGKHHGQCKGKGGSMHIYNLEVRNMGCNGIVGGGHGLSTGAALVQKMKKTKDIVVCYMGDGATNEGSFHEALNMASIWNLPLIFFVINNQYGISMPQKKAMNVEVISERACAYKVKGIHVEDGNDVLAVYDAMCEAVEHVRSGKGPVLIDTNTYRWFGHSASDAGAYRTREEVQQWKEKDPIKAFRTKLIEQNLASEKELDDLETSCIKAIEDAIAYAKADKLPPAEVAFSDNYAD